jgi:putative spermidine/putrescine transport system permease protein
MNATSVPARPVERAPSRARRTGAVETFGRGRIHLVFVGGMAVYLTLPFLATLLYSLATVWRNRAFPDGLTIRWWTQTLTDDRLLAAVTRSTVLALLTTLVVNLVVLPALYWAHVRRWGLRTFMQLCALLPFALPFLVVAYGIKSVAQLTPWTQRFESSTLLLLIGHVALAFPFLLWAADGGMAAANVRRLSQAAEVCGAGPLTTLLRVVIPNIRTGILTGSVLVFATSFSEYSVARVITGTSFETLPLWQVSELNETAGNPNGVAVITVATFLLLLAMSIAIGRLAQQQVAGPLFGVWGRRDG